MRNVFPRLSRTVFAAGALFLIQTVQGSTDSMLKLNGTFQGVPDGAETAPGWTIAKGRNGAVCSKVTFSDDGKGTMELRADDEESVGAFSPFFAANGNVLEFEFEVQGIGSGTNLGYGEYVIGYQGFDGARKHILGADGLQTGTLYPVVKKERCYLPLREGVKFFRICLVARPGATAKFSNLYVWLNDDASQKALPAEPTSSQALPDPQAAASVKSASKLAAPISLNDLPFLLTDYRYKNDELKPAYQIIVPLGDRITVELEEDSYRGELWSVNHYNVDICRIRMEHSRFGVANLRKDSAKIKLEALKQGTTNVVFVNANGKKMTLRFIVR